MEFKIRISRKKFLEIFILGIDISIFNIYNKYVS